MALSAQAGGHDGGHAGRDVGGGGGPRHRGRRGRALIGAPVRTSLHLLRHAAVETGPESRCRGRTDVSLSDAGRESARWLAKSFKGRGLAAVYSSPLSRAVATATPIAAAEGLDVICLEGLAEIDFGQFEDRRFDEIALAEPELYERWMTTPTQMTFPGGESYAEMKSRAVEAARGIVRRHRGDRVLAVTHSGPIRAIVGELLEIPDHAVFRVDVTHASLTLVEWVDDHPVLRGLNVEVTQ